MNDLILTTMAMSLDLMSSDEVLSLLMPAATGDPVREAAFGYAKAVEFGLVQANGRLRPEACVVLQDWAKGHTPQAG